MCQSITVYRQKNIPQRYALSVYTAFSSVALIGFLCFEGAIVNHGLPWIQLLASAAVCLGLLSIPRRPVVFRAETAVLNESGVSTLDWIFFSWGLHREASALPATLKLQDLPRIPFSQSAAAGRRQLDAADQTRALWRQLATIFQKPLALQWSLVLLEAASEFGSRFVVHSLLRRLETRPEIDASTWAWVALLALSLLSVSACGNWSSWIGHTRIQLPMLGLLQSLAFEKSLRLRSGGDGNSTDGKRRMKAPSVTDAIQSHRHVTRHRNLISRYDTNSVYHTAILLPRLFLAPIIYRSPP